MHSPPNSTQGTVRIDLKNQRFSGKTGGSERKERRGLRTAELQLTRSTVYLPSIAIGEGEDVVLIVLQTRDTACGGTTALLGQQPQPIHFTVLRDTPTPALFPKFIYM